MTDEAKVVYMADRYLYNIALAAVKYAALTDEVTLAEKPLTDDINDPRYNAHCFLKDQVDFLMDKIAAETAYREDQAERKEGADDSPSPIVSSLLTADAHSADR